MKKQVCWRVDSEVVELLKYVSKVKCKPMAYFVDKALLEVIDKELEGVELTQDVKDKIVELGSVKDRMVQELLNK